VASYFTPSRYVVSGAYFATSATTRGPLTALRDGTDGGNGLYRYGSTAGSFPNNTYNSENYWVDVVYQDSATDTTPPSLVAQTPTPAATGVPTNTQVTATYNEPVKVGSATVALRNPAGTLIPGTTTYDTSGTRVVFEPGTALQASTTYSVQVTGVSDAANNVAPTASWSFQTAAPAPPAPDQGPGGPIAVVTSSTAPISTYLAEIMRGEGLNEFSTMGAAALTAANLAAFRVVVLGDVPVTDAQVTALSDWVTAGGDLILMRPDPRFLSLAGLTAQTGSVSDGYLAVDASTAPGAGITTDTMQFHGTANRYALSGATTVATLYTTATASTGLPAVTWRTVGTSGGQVATFAFDLAKSIVQTRQGNPAWAGQERDGTSPVRSDDQYFGGTSTDWVNLSKVQIPQADEQQRLLANLITVMSRDKLPMPRFWYFPDTTKAVVVATGDDHGNGGTKGRFDAYLAASPPGCSVAAWTCPRFTSYIYPSTPFTSADASAYTAQGFEVALHPQNQCNDYGTLTDLQGTYSADLAAWRAKYTGIASPTTSRYHCIVWSDWSSQPKAELANGIRLDTNYYYWPGTWVQDRPGFMTGSGIPQRLTDTDGSLIDVYQAHTFMTDESQQSYPATPNALLDRALGPLGYYGAFTANVHTDYSTTYEDSQLLASAQAHGVPVITARQLLTWTDGRNGSSFGNLAWSGGNLTFTIAVGTGASRLTAMLPTTGPGGLQIATLSRGGTSVAFTKMTVKGQEYAVFPASAGSWTATYTTTGSLTAGPARVTATRETGATVAWSTTRAATSTVLVGAGAGSLSPVERADRTTQHRVVLSGLRPGATYRYRVVSRLPNGTTRAWPAYGRPAATFRTRAVDTLAPTISRLRTISLPDGTARVSWQTSEPSDSLVSFGQTALPLLGAETRRDGELVRRHTVVLTGLDPSAAYWLSAESADAAGNSASTSVVALDTGKAGVALQSSQFLTGTLSGDLRLGDGGFGALTLPGGGRGTFESTTQDSRLKGDWRQALVEDSGATGARTVVAVRTGSSPEPNGSWTGWRTVATDGSTFRSPGRYLQFRVTMVAPTGTAYSVTAVGFTHDGTPPEVVGEGD
ncbi:Ig-like domain-containing protein, partial [Nocardioides ginsengisegetis]